MNAKRGTVVLGFSGGLDTSYTLLYLKELGYEVVTVTVDLGQKEDFDLILKRSKELYAAESIFVDGKSDFCKHFLRPAIQANGLYQGMYPLATALGRPYIGYCMALLAKSHGTNLLSHGCTGKGNDQVRIELAAKAIVPNAEFIDPVRDGSLSRDEEIAYLASKGISVKDVKEKKYSIDQNLWGRAICAGPLEDPWSEPESDVFEWTSDIHDAPHEPEYVEIGFREGIPETLNGETKELIDIIEELNERGGRNGIGRIDHIEDRVVGIKSREVYEAPGATIIITAHKALEALTLTKESLDFKLGVEREIAEIAYKGFWFSSHLFDLLTYLTNNQRRVSGLLKVKLWKGRCEVVGRKSTQSLYEKELGTYGLGSTFNQEYANAFIAIFGQQNLIDIRKNLLGGGKPSDELLDSLASGSSIEQTTSAL